MPTGVKEKNKPKLLLYMSHHQPKQGWGWGRQLHCHDFCEIMFVREGSGKIAIKDQIIPFKKGDIVIYNPGTMHREYIDDVNPRTINFIGISNLAIDGLKAGCLCEGDFSVLSTESFYQTFCFYLEQLYAEKDLRDLQSQTIYKNLLNIIIAGILRLSEDASKAVENKKTYADAKRYIDENFTKIESVDDLCKNLYINKFYLTHLFSEHYGISPLQYLIKKRITLAKQLLIVTDQKVDDIADICGYDDMAYFCRIFKKQESITPLQFRKLHRKDS